MGNPMSTGEKILVVDDHPVVLDGLVLILSELMPHGVIFKATNGASARELVNAHRNLDWIILDVNLPDANGIELLAHFESMKLTANTIVLSSDSSPETADRALKQNASAFLSKSFERAELEKCIDTVESGQIYLAPELRRELNNYRKSVLAERRQVTSNLTDRQLQTLSLLAAGYTNKEIAHSCNVAESTIKSRVKLLMTAFDADNRTHCVFEAKRLNII